MRGRMRQASDGASQLGQRDHDDAGNRLLAKAKGEDAVRADSGACSCSVRRRWFSSCSSRILQPRPRAGTSAITPANTPASAQRPRPAASGWAVGLVRPASPQCMPCVMRPHSLSGLAPMHTATRIGAQQQQQREEGW